jgi:hypothetical protein
LRLAHQRNCQDRGILRLKKVAAADREVSLSPVELQTPVSLCFANQGSRQDRVILRLEKDAAEHLQVFLPLADPEHPPLPYL